MNETLEPVSVAPGISFALEQLLINERKTDADVVAQNLTVLSNLLMLVRFEFRYAARERSEFLNFVLQFGEIPRIGFASLEGLSNLSAHRQVSAVSAGDSRELPGKVHGPSD